MVAHQRAYFATVFGRVLVLFLVVWPQVILVVEIFLLEYLGLRLDRPAAKLSPGAPRGAEVNKRAPEGSDWLVEVCAYGNEPTQ